MSTVPKPVTKANLYPGTKYKNMDTGDTKVSKDNYSGGKGFKAKITGEGESGKSGGHMGPGKALEKGGKICDNGEYGAAGEYGKMKKTATPKMKEAK